MSKLTITISENAHEILKQRAKADRRSLTNYLTCLLEDLTKEDETQSQPSKKKLIIGDGDGDGDTFNFSKNNKRLEEDDDGWAQLN